MFGPAHATLVLDSSRFTDERERPDPNGARATAIDVYASVPGTVNFSLGYDMATPPWPSFATRFFRW